MRKSLFKKGLVIGILVLFICMSILPSTAVDTVKESIMQASNGNTLYVGGTGQGNYTTIQDAIDNASNGDTVFVYDDSSPYYEHVCVYKRINLIGENRNSTIINAGDWLGSVVSIPGEADNVLVSGFTITDSNTGIWGCEGIFIDGNNNIIQGNIIAFNHYGIDISGDADNNVITDNIIVHNSHAGICDEYRDSKNTVKWNVIGGNGREAPDSSPYKKGGIYKHRSGGSYYHNDFDLNYGYNAFTDWSSWGVWDDGSEGNYWDDWENNPGYPDVYIISGTIEDQVDRYPTAIPYFNHTIVLIEQTSYIAEPGEPIDFSADVNKPSSSVSWFWEFGDGITSNKKRPVHAYNKSGIYKINVTVTDNQGVSDTDIGFAYIGIPPDKPTIKGPTKGRPRGWYEYSIVANDSDSDYLHYYIDWADGYEDYIGPYPSGEVVKINHTWLYKANYTVMVKAIDETLLESEWATLDVTMPRSKLHDSFLTWLLDRFPNAFPILKYILGLQ